MRKVDTLRRTPEKRPPTKRTRPAFSSLNVMRYRLLALFAIIGPGFITANVDNDPGGILTYSQAGAKYGYTLLWTLVPIHPVALIVVQEMAAARMGAIKQAKDSPISYPRRVRPAHDLLHYVRPRTRRFRQHRSRVRGATPRAWASSA